MVRIVILLTALFSFLDLNGQIVDAPRHQNYPYYVSIAAFFQQEARFLKEWIEFHKMVGVEHFYLYNNSSQDSYLEVLAPYIEAGEVELFDYPSDPKKNWTFAQYRAMEEAISLAKKTSRWLIMLDIDEFVVPYGSDSLVDFLQKNENYSQICCLWRMFGTSFVERIPENQLLLETLVFREAFIPGHTRLTKTIVKPQAIEKCEVHLSHLIPPKKTLYLSDGLVEYPPLLIHHYWTRDIDFLKSVKMERQHRISGNWWSEEYLQKQIALFNDVEDHNIDRFLPELRERVFNP